MIHLSHYVQFKANEAQQHLNEMINEKSFSSFRPPRFINNNTSTNSERPLSRVLEYLDTYNREHELLLLEHHLHSHSDAHTKSTITSDIGGYLMTDNKNGLNNNNNGDACESKNNATHGANVNGDEPSTSSYEKKETDENDLITLKSNESNNDEKMKEAIAMLEPHLTSFRRLCGEGNNNTISNNNNEKEVDLMPNIPQSLIRVARFSPFKWIPIKRALLRPPVLTEV